MPPRRPAVPLALAALAGAAVGPLVPPTLLLALAAAGPVAGAVTLTRWRATDRGPRLATRTATALLLVGVAGLMGAWSARAQRRLERLQVDPPGPTDGPSLLSGTLLSGPSPAGPGRARLLLATGPAGTPVVVEAAKRSIGGQASPGARVTALGRFARPDPSLQRAGAAARLIAVEVRTTPGDARVGFIDACVRHAGHVIDRGARPRHAAFLRAVILGERGGMDRAALAAFRGTGTAHLLSISGLHVTVLASLVLLLARGLGLRRLEQALAVSACAALYVAVAGAGVPTVRAAAAGVVGVTLIGRGDAWNRLAVGLLAALVVEPRAALQVGTVLSFGTVAGLLLLEPVVRRGVERDDPLERARPRAGAATLIDRAARVVPASIAAFAASAPLLALTLGQLPLASLLLNPPCIALFSVALALGVGGVLVGVVAPAPGAWLVAAADVPTGWIFALVEGGAALPEAPVVPPPPTIAVLALGALALAVARRERRGGCRALLAGATVLLLGLALPRPARHHAPLAPARTAPAVAVVSAGPTVIVGSPDGALGFGDPPARRSRLADALDRACGTRRVRWLDPTTGSAARLPGARVVALSPGVFLLEVQHVTALVVTREAREAPPGWTPPRADVVVAPRARPALAAALVARSGARRALVPVACALPPGVARLTPTDDGVTPLIP